MRRVNLDLRLLPASGPLLLALLLGLAPLSRAQNLAQLTTNDPGTPGERRLEINLGWTTDHRPGAVTQSLPALELNYGAGPCIQLTCATNRLRAQSDGDPTVTGFGNITAGLKWRYLDQPDAGFTASLFPQVEFRSADFCAINRGLAVDETTLTVAAQAQWMRGPYALVAGCGHIAPSQSPGGWLAGLALNREFGPRLALAVELTGGGPGKFSHANVTLGAWFALHESSVLLVSIGRELHRTDSARATLLSYVGWRYSD